MPLAQGTELGKYEIMGPLGAGAMGEVFRARDRQLGREVALKVLPETFAAGAATVAVTHKGVILGTVGYMSPEQASGKPADFASDQFSLGTILYEMATGNRAFLRDTAVETLTAILREEPQPIAQANVA